MTTDIVADELGVPTLSDERLDDDDDAAIHRFVNMDKGWRRAVVNTWAREEEPNAIIVSSRLACLLIIAVLHRKKEGKGGNLLMM